MDIAEIRQHFQTSRPVEAPPAGDHLLNPGIFDPDALSAAKPAAVLIPLIKRGNRTTLLLTERSAFLRKHSGQIAFPGGRLDAGETVQDAALRETFEEVGIPSGLIAPFGQMPAYLSGTGYLIHPVLAELNPDFTLKLNRDEVSDTFEVPLDFLMNPENHQTHSREWNGATRYFYAMPYGERYIWGVTAGIIRALYERLKS